MNLMRVNPHARIRWKCSGASEMEKGRLTNVTVLESNQFSGVVLFVGILDEPPRLIPLYYDRY